MEVLTETSVRVSWNNSDLFGITELVVYYRQTGNKDFRIEQEQKVVVSPAVTAVTINNLVSRTEYVFEVVARATSGIKSVSGSRSGPEPLIIQETMVTTEKPLTHTGLY